MKLSPEDLQCIEFIRETFGFADEKIALSVGLGLGTLVADKLARQQGQQDLISLLEERNQQSIPSPRDVLLSLESPLKRTRLIDDDADFNTVISSIGGSLSLK
jgi:hypothetical protein